MITNIRFLIQLYNTKTCATCDKLIPAGSQYCSFVSDHMGPVVNGVKVQKQYFCHNNYGCIPGDARDTLWIDPLYKALLKYDGNELYALGSLKTTNQYPFNNRYAKNCLICHKLVTLN